MVPARLASYPEINYGTKTANVDSDKAQWNLKDQEFIESGNNKLPVGVLLLTPSLPSLGLDIGGQQFELDYERFPKHCIRRQKTVMNTHGKRVKKK